MKTVHKVQKNLVILILTIVVYFVLSLISDAPVSAYHDEVHMAGRTLSVTGSPMVNQKQGQGPEANLPYFFSVFAVTWVGFFAYVFLMSKRQGELRREIEALKEARREKEEQEENEP